jgi:spermidine/putrescine transport system substrate-binding protein
MLNKKLTRRNFMERSTAMAAAFAAGTGFSLGTAQAAREKELNILCWEGYNSAQVLDPFREAHGATVKAESLTNDPTMINRLRAGETKVWDLINVNNPWARKVMMPEGLIKPLDRATMEPFFDKMLPAFKPPYKWAMDESGQQLIGMCQRFGPYSFVVPPMPRNTAFWNPTTGTCSTSAASPASIPSRCIPTTRSQSSPTRPSACSRAPSSSATSRR